MFCGQRAVVLLLILFTVIQSRAWTQGNSAFHNGQHFCFVYKWVYFNRFATQKNKNKKKIKKITINTKALPDTIWLFQIDSSEIHNRDCTTALSIQLEQSGLSTIVCKTPQK